MSWVKENKFLAGLLGVVVVGGGALGYLVFSAKSKADESTQTFESQAQELNRLEHLPAYPDQENLVKLQAQRDEHVALLDKLQRDLAAIKEPTEPLDPRAFQDRLRDAVTDFLKKAEGKMALPQKGNFYLGFDRYQSAPPTPEAAPLLGRELKGVQFVLGTLLSNSVTELRDFKRDELPEEGGKAKAADPAKPPAAPAKRGRGGDKDLLRKYGMDVTFLAPQSSFQNVINQLSTSSTSNFVIVRYLAIENSNPKAPPKVSESALPGVPDPSLNPVPPQPQTPAGPGNSPPPAPPSTPDAGPGVSKPIAGEESVEVTMRLEVVDFAEPAAAEGAAAKPKKNPS